MSLWNSISLDFTAYLKSDTKGPTQIRLWLTLLRPFVLVVECHKDGC
jgi:hypothetical protein